MIVLRLEGGLYRVQGLEGKKPLLEIRQWVSRYEGDLVAKCYFTKHKLVWEVLDGGLKNKIEIQWNDMCVRKVVCQKNEPGTLEIAATTFLQRNQSTAKEAYFMAGNI